MSGGFYATLLLQNKYSYIKTGLKTVLKKIEHTFVWSDLF